MNLAEIRKKANRDRENAAAHPEKKLDLSSEPAETVDSGGVWHDSIALDLGSEPEPVRISELREDTVADEDDFMPESHVDEESVPPALPDPTPVPATPALTPPDAAEVRSSANGVPVADLNDRSEPEPLSGSEADVPRQQLFDPLAILIAGRASSGFGDERELSSENISEPLLYMEFLCFRVCAEEYAVNIMEIREIIKLREITEVPRTPDFISGVLSLRGTIIPVFNMARRLHLEPGVAGSRERIIVISKGDELYGIQVDEVLQVVRIPRDSIEPPPTVLEGIDRDFVQGIGRHSGRMLILLNMANIIDLSLY